MGMAYGMERVIDRVSTFGITGDIPVSGDWNADGRTEIGVFRPSTHLYYRDFNGNGVWDGAVIDQVSTFRDNRRHSGIR